MFRDETVPFESHDCATATYFELPSNYIDVNNVEFDVTNQIYPKGEEPGDARAQCSFWQSGLCQVKFFELAPWSDYKVVSTDYTSYSIVYGCDTFLAGAIKLEWLWVLTRTALEIGTSDWTTMRDNVFDIITDRIPSYDPTTRLRPTIQTVGSGCSYTAFP